MTLENDLKLLSLVSKDIANSKELIEKLQESEKKNKILEEANTNLQNSNDRLIKAINQLKEYFKFGEQLYSKFSSEDRKNDALQASYYYGIATDSKRALNKIEELLG